MTHITRLTVLPVTLALVATMAGTASAGAPTWIVAAADRPSLTPGGSVYDSQVPSAARTAGSASNGGSLYDSQVPAGAR